MLDRASNVWNNGYPGGNDKVNVYWGKRYSGARACLNVGDAWSNLVGHWFAYGPGLPGYGQGTTTTSPPTSG